MQSLSIIFADQGTMTLNVISEAKDLFELNLLNSVIVKVRDFKIFMASYWTND